MRKTTTEMLDFVQNDDLEGLQPRKDKLRGFFATTPASKLPPQRTSSLGTPVLAGDPGFPLRMTTLKVSGRMTIFEYQRLASLTAKTRRRGRVFSI
jgi:hypothetical protein